MELSDNLKSKLQEVRNGEVLRLSNEAFREERETERIAESERVALDINSRLLPTLISDAIALASLAEIHNLKPNFTVNDPLPYFKKRKRKDYERVAPILNKGWLLTLGSVLSLPFEYETSNFENPERVYKEFGSVRHILATFLEPNGTLKLIEGSAASDNETIHFQMNHSKEKTITLNETKKDSIIFHPDRRNNIHIGEHNPLTITSGISDKHLMLLDAKVINRSFEEFITKYRIQ